MGSWNKVVMSDADIAQWKHMELQEEFEAIFMLSNPSKDFVMFGDRRFNGNNHNYFFSKEAMISPLVKALMVKYSGVCCDQPKQNEVSLLVGHADSWDILETV